MPAAWRKLVVRMTKTIDDWLSLTVRHFAAGNPGCNRQTGSRETSRIGQYVGAKASKQATRAKQAI